MSVSGQSSAARDLVGCRSKPAPCPSHNQTVTVPHIMTLTSSGRHYHFHVKFYSLHKTQMHQYKASIFIIFITLFFFLYVIQLFLNGKPRYWEDRTVICMTVTPTLQVQSANAVIESINLLNQMSPVYAFLLLLQKMDSKLIIHIDAW